MDIRKCPMSVPIVETSQINKGRSRRNIRIVEVAVEVFLEQKISLVEHSRVGVGAAQEGDVVQTHGPGGISHYDVFIEFCPLRTTCTDILSGKKYLCSIS